MESNLDPRAVATTSSARGLFQFIDQTWLGTVKEAGAALGYSQYADAITRSSSGTYSVSDPAMRKAILDLRNDPAASAAMAGVLTHSNSFKLIGRIGRRPTDAELYMAHFMGVGGAAKLISSAEATPARAARNCFPTRRPPIARSSTIATAAPAACPKSIPCCRRAMPGRRAWTRRAPRWPPPMPCRQRQRRRSPPIDNAAYLSSFPDARAVKSASATQPAQDVSFRTLFQTGARAEPVSSAVQQLWVNGQSSAAPSEVLQATPELRRPNAFDLFSDRAGVFSG